MKSLEAEIPGVRMNPKNPTSEEEQEHENSGHACLQELVCCWCRRSRCWWATSNWTVGGRGKKNNKLDCSFRLRFLDIWKRRHVSNSELSRQQVWSNGSDAFCGRKSPTSYSISFLVGFIKDLNLRRITPKCDNELNTKALQARREDTNVVRTTWRWSFGQRACWKWLWEKWNDNAEFSEFPLNIAQMYVSQMTVRYSVEFLAAPQIISKMRIGSKWKKKWIEGKSQWCNLERKFGFVKFEKCVSSFISRMTQGIFVDIMIEQKHFCASRRMELCEAKVGQDSH